MLITDWTTAETGQADVATRYRRIGDHIEIINRKDFDHVPDSTPLLTYPFGFTVDKLVPPISDHTIVRYIEEEWFLGTKMRIYWMKETKIIGRVAGWSDNIVIKEDEDMSDAYNDQKQNQREQRRQRHPEHFNSTAPEVGHKLDQGKPKVSLIPSEAILEMATAFTYGANKYGSDNFKAGIKYRRLIDAALRHILAISSGEDVDSESGNKHVGHAMASLAMLCYMMQHKPDMDDRYREDK